MDAFTLSYDEQNGDWVLKEDETDRVVHRFPTKEEAMKEDVLENAVGEGSVKIQNQDGSYEEERTYPRSQDPFSSEG